jgi:hypothetical protein
LMVGPMTGVLTVIQMDLIMHVVHQTTQVISVVLTQRVDLVVFYAMIDVVYLRRMGVYGQTVGVSQTKTLVSMSMVVNFYQEDSRDTKVLLAPNVANGMLNQMNFPWGFVNAQIQIGQTKPITQMTHVGVIAVVVAHHMVLVALVYPAGLVLAK